MTTTTRNANGDTDMANEMTRAQAKAEAAERGVKYRITKDGEVHFYGVMPNTNIAGWYFFGWAA